MTLKNRWILPVLGAVALAIAVPAVWAAEEIDSAKVADRAVENGNPDKVDPVSVKGEDWTYDMKVEDPQPIVVTTPGGEKEVYWYVLYTVTNTSKAEHTYVPTFTMYSDTTAVDRAGIYPAVFAAILKHRRIQFLENSANMFGKVLPGPDNARTCVAIFRPMDRETTHFTIFVEGISGQFIERPNPLATDKSKPEEKVLTLRRTLALQYKIPGDKWWKNMATAYLTSKTYTWR
jgi:hypothetical protein